MKKSILVSGVLLLASLYSQAQSFTAGNLSVLQISGATSKASSPINILEFSTGGIATNSVSLPSTGSTPIQTSGVYGGSEGFLTTSSDGKLLVLGGYGTSSSFSDITSTTASSVARVVGTISPFGVYTQVASSNSFFSGNDIRSAVSDGTNFWTSGASIASVDGIDYFGPGAQVGLAAGATPPKGYGLRLFNGQIYYSTQKSGPVNTSSQLGIFSISGGTPTSGSVTVMQVINTGTLTPEDFSFNATADICYIAINMNSADGGIQKWVNNTGTWNLAYTLGTGITNTGAYGLVVDYSGADPIIYATTFDSGGNRIIKIVDTGASSIATTLVAATSGVYYKGITFSPIDSGTPIVNLSLSANTGSEAAATAITISVTASAPVVGNQTVALNVSGTNITSGDYTLTNSFITIANGTTTGTETFTIVDDAIVENTEIASITISSPSSGIALGSITSQTLAIIDNDGNNPPAIKMNVATTTNYIDGGVNTSPASPYSISGAIGDVTDPAITLGVDFLIHDVETPATSLTVTARSSKTNIVPTASLTLTGTDSIRTLKINPAAVGYDTITIKVFDGTDSSLYVIDYACSDPTPVLNANNTFWHTGTSDASDAIAIDDNFYMTGDDELDYISVYSRNHSGLPFVTYNFAPDVNLPDPGGSVEVDVEAAASSPYHANLSYWIGSMSNGKGPTYDVKPNRDRLFATTYSGTGASTIISPAGACGIRDAIVSWGDANGFNFTASAAAGMNPKSPAGFSAEGMVFAPDSTTLWIGMRAPLVPLSTRDKAVLIPVLNFETWFNNGSPSGNPTMGSPIELDLGLNGIRDIIRLSNGTYIIIAGSPLDDAGANDLYKWTGYAGDAPILLSTIADGVLNIEGAMEIHNSGNLSLTQLQVVTDNGAAILYQDANQAKDFADLNYRKFRSDIISANLDICSGFHSGITANGNTTFCQGDSVKLTASGSNGSYYWSNGDTTSSVEIKASGTYSLTITNNHSNCSATSSQSVAVNALPAIPGITQNGDVLTSSTASSYQWYFNGSVINGSTSQSYTATQSGNYAVEITDANGCSSVSNPIAVTTSGITSVNSTKINSIKPNPFENYFELELFTEKGDCTIELYNTIGDKIIVLFNGEVSEGNNHFAFSSLPELNKGVYFVKIQNSSNYHVLKVIQAK